jgi:hypothetical protein
MQCGFNQAPQHRAIKNIQRYEQCGVCVRMGAQPELAF